MYAVRDTAKADKRPWKGAWVSFKDSGKLEIGDLLNCDMFGSLERAQSVAMNYAVKHPEYIGRFVIHHVEWGTSGRQLIINRAEH